MSGRQLTVTIYDGVHVVCTVTVDCGEEASTEVGRNRIKRRVLNIHREYYRKLIDRAFDEYLREMFYGQSE